MVARDRLETLARHYSVDLSYDDIDGQEHVASDTSLIYLLKSLGVDASTDDAIDTALQTRRLELAHRVLEPVVVFWEGEAPAFVVRVPAQEAGGRYRVELKFEQGTQLRLEGSLPTLRVIETFSVNDEGFADVEVRLNERLPFGYHQLTFELNDKKHTALAISAPQKAFLPDESRMWGLFAPTYAIRSVNDHGTGGLAELAKLVDLTKNAQGHVVATLPLMSVFLDELFQPSPYVPASKLFWNELFLDLHHLAHVQNSEAARIALTDPDFVEESNRLKTLEHVDYRAQARLHRSVLEILAREAFEDGSPLRNLIESYAEHTPRVADYARFRAVTETLRTPWMTWPQRLREGDIKPEDFNLQFYHYHLYAQWRLEQQLSNIASRARSAGGGLYLDLPLGVHPDGYDAWRDRDVFLDGMNAGAPPDALGPDGQDWGFRPLHPEKLRNSGYAYLIDCIQTQVRHAGVLRIDHVMGLHRIFCVPWNMGGTEGVYVRYHPDEIWAIVTLESIRHGVMIVGEDLGTVPPEVREAMDRHDAQRMFVLQFELTHDRNHAIQDIPVNAVASINTHDTPTFAGFWADQDIDDRVSLGRLNDSGADASRGDRAGLKTALVDFLQNRELLPNADQHLVELEDIVRAVVAHLSQSPARLVLLNLEDLWLEPNPQNVPGTSDERPNWRRRFRNSLEEANNMDSVERAISTVTSSRGRTETISQLNG